MRSCSRSTKADTIAHDPIIKLEKVSTIYEGERVPSILDMDLEVERGEFVCVIGPNGAGKTTLLETLNGILPYYSGSGRVLGLEIKGNLKRIRKKTGYVLQNFDIDPLAPFLCRDIVMSGRAGRIGILRFTGKADREIVREAMGQVGMSGFEERPVGKLSGGEFQKILLARAIAQQPELLLLDEPFSHLDYEARNKMQTIITDMNRKQSVTVIMVSHYIDTVPEACDRILVMQKGRMLMDGGRDEILRSEQITDIFLNRGCSGP